AHCRKEIGGRILLRPRLDYSAATVADFCTAALSRRRQDEGSQYGRFAKFLVGKNSSMLKGDGILLRAG
ncbi:hypothetical protein, partial [Brucella endophytica]|uniref:hypothetical protein n=1 Tax=Brucella endophytica TaxID=1963359 RepID=UPI0035BBD492